jgi:hypothetical protein
MSERRCLDCDWGILELYGYSDYTVESESFTCLKMNREAETDSYPYGEWSKFMRFAEECDLYKPSRGGCLVKGVDETYAEAKAGLPDYLQEYFQEYIDSQT